MKRFASILLLGLAGCSAARYETVTYPPRVDLAKHEMIGVVEFSSPDARELAPVVTARFMESARSDQGTVRMITIHEPSVRSGRAQRTTSRSRRRTRLRTTAGPTRRDVTMPTRAFSLPCPLRIPSSIHLP